MSCEVIWFCVGFVVAIWTCLLIRWLWSRNADKITQIPARVPSE